MANDDLIEQYLNHLTRLLPGHSRRARRFWLEVEAHLQEAADELQRNGLEPTTAMAAAIERFGAPADVLKRFELEAPFNNEDDAMIRKCLVLLCVLTVACGALLFIVSWFDDAPLPLTFAKAAVAAIITLYSLVLLKESWTSGPKRAWVRWLEFGGGLALIAIGAAAAVWTAHLGQVTGDWEYYGFAAAGLLALQGAFAAISVAMSQPGDHSLGC